MPIVNTLPTTNDIQQSRVKLLESEHFSFYTKVYDFYNSNTFADLIFNPLITSTDQFMTFVKIGKLIQDWGLKVICIDDNMKALMQQQQQQLKDDFEAMDQFAAKNKKHFTTMINVTCEVPVPEVKVDLHKDPLGVKSFLSKYIK
jgi:hypothetical protein